MTLEGMMAKDAPHLIAITSVYRFDGETRVGKHDVKPEEYPADPYPPGSFIDAERQPSRATMCPKELA